VLARSCVYIPGGVWRGQPPLGPDGTMVLTNAISMLELNADQTQITAYRIDFGEVEHTQLCGREMGWMMINNKILRGC